ncbi:hypothetical protein CMUS01_11612 [Colletotrichum musicola]|uniref:Uncharacterized protein n=1 Tax=Colletotrichum musicola TaxID=2175873 RepID=A0A8H6JVF7_9PEZI|nr:hypothetical protein CMUS01_11612 [Colletotrichum musicola]
MSQRGVSIAVGADWLMAPEQTEKQGFRSVYCRPVLDDRSRDPSGLLDSNQAPEDAATVKAFRFDRCYQPEDDGNLLHLYRCLIVDVGVAAGDVQKGIAQGPFISITLMTMTLTRAIREAKDKGEPADGFIGAYHWFQAHRHIFLPSDHAWNHLALFHACMVLSEDSDFGELIMVIIGNSRHIPRDIDYRAFNGEHIAYLITHPPSRCTDKSILYYSGPESQAPAEIKTIEQFTHRAPPVVVRVSATLAEAKAALAEDVARAKAERVAKAKAKAQEALSSATRDLAGLKVEDVD